MNVWSISIGPAIYDDSSFLLPVSTCLGRDSLHTLTPFSVVGFSQLLRPVLDAGRANLGSLPVSR